MYTFGMRNDPDDATPLVNKTNKDGVGGGDNEFSFFVCVHGVIYCVCVVTSACERVMSVRRERERERERESGVT